MADISSWHEPEDENLYWLPEHDSLGILTSTRNVVEQGEFVWINIEQVEKMSEQLVHEDQEKIITSSPLWDQRYHFHDGTERSVNWILLLDALNFCFWAEKNQPRWNIDYQGEILNGYWAEAAALKRAVEEGIPLWDASYLSKISKKVVTHIFRGTDALITIPLLEQRIANAREVGKVLSEHYNGQFSHAIKQANGSAVQLALLLARDFSSFNDTATYHKRTVRFLKRAQICIADLYGSFGAKQWGAFDDLDQLTIFADYKLPQVLRHFNVLEYYPTLAERIDNQQLLEPGSEEEIAIRACTIWASELLRRALLRHGHTINAAEIDQRLWLIGQNSADMRPYHRTRTIYY